jgi:hypothetical protein
VEKVRELGCTLDFLVVRRDLNFRDYFSDVRLYFLLIFITKTPSLSITSKEDLGSVC